MMGHSDSKGQREAERERKAMQAGSELSGGLGAIPDLSGLNKPLFPLLWAGALDWTKV